MRESAERLGIPDFWAWWKTELAGLVPSRLRNRLQRWRGFPVVVFGPDVAVVWELASDDATLRYVETARIPLRGDDAIQGGRAVVDALARRTRSAGGRVRVVLALTDAQVLRKLLSYPAAVEGNLAQVLAYDLDRHTPFKSDELYSDAAVIGRDPQRNLLRVELVSALRIGIDQLRRQLASWGAEVVAIVPGLPALDGSAPARFNLLPEIDRMERPWRRWQVWIPMLLAVVLAGVALAVPLMQKRENAIALMQQVEQSRVQAGAADALRQQLERTVENYNFVLARKYAYPSMVQLLDDITRLLPDDTWLTQFDLKTLPRGKEVKKEIMLRGESGNAGRLISLLEESRLFEQAAPRSPTTKIQPGPGEIFDLGAQMKPLPMPPALPMGTVDAGASPIPAASPPGAAAAGPAPASGVRAGSPVSPGKEASVATPAPQAGPGGPPAPSTPPSAEAGSTRAPGNPAPAAKPSTAPGAIPPPTSRPRPPAPAAPAVQAPATPPDEPATFGPRPPPGVVY
ncbi:MAG: PilN domain-containing protein [Casimicrobiaceae bacterium]